MMRSRLSAALYIISLFTSGLSIIAYITNNEADAIFFLGLAILARVWAMDCNKQ